MSATPAQTILGEQPYVPGQAYEPQISEPVTFTCNAPPLPVPASEDEIGTLRYQLRAAQYELNCDLTRLAALHEARHRASAQWSAEEDGVREAEAALRHVRLHSRAHLVEAYVNNGRRGDDRGRCQGSASHPYRLPPPRPRDHRRAAPRIASIENGLKERRDECARAAGQLLSRTAPLIGLVQNIYDAYATLRDSRLILNEIGKLVWIDDDLAAVGRERLAGRRLPAR